LFNGRLGGFLPDCTEGGRHGHLQSNARKQREAYVKTSSPPDFPDWLPKAVQQQATELWEKLPKERNPIKAKQVLEQLIINPLMERVWDELYREYRERGKGYFNAARIAKSSDAASLPGLVEKFRKDARELRKKGGEKNKADAESIERDAKSFERAAQFIELSPDEPGDPRWSEQDRAAQSFLSRAYRGALYTDLQLLSDLRAKTNKLQEIAKKLRGLAKDLQSLGLVVTEVYAQKLFDVALDCISDAQAMEPDPAAKAWLVTRMRGDTQRRTYVAKLAYATRLLFDKTLFNTMANVTNVVFSGKNHDVGQKGEISEETVRDMLRRRPKRTRPNRSVAAGHVDRR
jgi:hypothetical protein